MRKPPLGHGTFPAGTLPLRVKLKTFSISGEFFSMIYCFLQVFMIFG
jgi:hypothetical protein